MPDPTSKPMDTATVVSLALASYGAVVATINSVIQYRTESRDRADVMFTIRKNMSIMNDRRYEGRRMTLISAVNRGRRPVTIQGFGANLLDTREQFWLRETTPRLPAELNESQEVTAFANQAGGELDAVESWFCWDSVGRHHYKHIRPWYRRLWSKLRRRFAPVER